MFVYQHFYPTSSETTMPIQFIFYMGFLLDGGTKSCSNYSGQTSKTHIVKTLKIDLWNQWALECSFWEVVPIKLGKIIIIG